MAVPLKLVFQPSQRRQEKQLIRREIPENTSNTILNPLISPLTTVTASSNPMNADVEATMTSTLLSPDPNARPKHFRNLFEECIFVFAIMMATSATTFIQGVTIINTATIGNDLKMTSAQITWITAAVGLSSGSFMLFFGKTADLFGRKVQLLVGMASLSLFSFITFFAPNPMAMNILCGFLGLGTAIISPPAVGILFATYPEGRRRNRATGALGSGNPIGFIMGSMSSGLATKLYSWRASFIVVSIFFFIMTLLASWTMPAMPRSGSMKLEVKRFDYIGTILTIMGMALFCASLTEGPVRGWKSPSVIIMLTIGLVLLCSFVIWERIYRFPLLNLSVWKNRNYTLCVLSVLFGYMSFITNSFWIALYMQQVQGFSPLSVAIRMLPQAIAGITWSYTGQALVSRISGTVLMGIGALAYLLGATLQIFVRQHTSYWKFLFPALVITVMGADFQFIVSNLYVSKQMPRQSSLAAGMLQTVMRLSVSLGLSITAAVYGSSRRTPEAQRDITFAFDRAYMCSILFATIGVLFVPFMRIEKQGGRPVENEKQTAICHDGIFKKATPRSRGAYRDSESQTPDDDPTLVWTGRNPSISTQATVATCGSNRSFFPRWSWEVEREWRNQRYQDFDGDERVIYEVCIKCLEERRVVVASPTRSLYGYEPTPLYGGDLGITEAESDSPLLSSPKGSGGKDLEWHSTGWL